MSARLPIVTRRRARAKRRHEADRVRVVWSSFRAMADAGYRLVFREGSAPGSRVTTTIAPDGAMVTVLS